MSTKILRKSTLALILALLTSGSGKVFVRSAPPSPVPAHPTSDVADIGGGAPDPTCSDGGCFAGASTTLDSRPTLEVADIGGGAPDPTCSDGRCFVGGSSRPQLTPGV